MATPNLFKTSQLVAEQIAFELWNAQQLSSKVYRKLESKFKMSNPLEGKIGPSFDVKKQRRYLTADGLEFVPQSMADQTFKVTVDQKKHVGLSMDVFEQTFTADGKITEMAAKDIKSAANSLSDAIDLSLANLGGASLFNAVGVPGSVPGATSALDTQQKLADARAYLTQAGVHTNTKRMAFMNPKASGYVPASLSGLFVREAQEAVKDGRIGSAVGTDFYESANIGRHTAGTAITAGTIASGVSTMDFQVDGANQVGSSLLLKSGGGAAHATKTFKAGDIIYLDVYQVNVVNKTPFASLQQFTITQDATSDANGAVTINISPEIITSGAYQTVNASPADSTVLHGYTTATRNFIIVPETLALVCIPYEELKGGVICSVATHKDISIMLTIFAEGRTLQQNARVDVAYGVAAQYPETGVIWFGE